MSQNKNIHPMYVKKLYLPLIFWAWIKIPKKISKLNQLKQRKIIDCFNVKIYTNSRLILPTVLLN